MTIIDDAWNKIAMKLSSLPYGTSHEIKIGELNCKVGAYGNLFHLLLENRNLVLISL